MKMPNVQIYKEKAVELARKGKDLVERAAHDVMNGVVVAHDKVGEKIDGAIIELEKKQLCPVFEDDFFDDSFEIPRMIRIVDYDKKHKDSKACEGSLGFLTATKHMNVLTMYSENAASQDIVSFYPNISETIFYEDPCQHNHYISLDTYFDYLKKARIDELESIAQDLGAKHVKITFKEEKKTFVAHKKKVAVDAKKKAAVDADENYTAEDYASFEVAANVSFAGNDTPICPQPIYFKSESDIQALIRARMNSDGQNPIKSKTYKIKYNKTSGMSENVAVAIDEALSQLKCAGTASVSSEAQKESRTILEYQIEF